MRRATRRGTADGGEGERERERESKPGTERKVAATVRVAPPWLATTKGNKKKERQIHLAVTVASAHIANNWGLFDFGDDEDEHNAAQGGGG
jgi:hypothetical protein